MKTDLFSTISSTDFVNTTRWKGRRGEGGRGTGQATYIITDIMKGTSVLLVAIGELITYGSGGMSRPNALSAMALIWPRFRPAHTGHFR